MDFVTHTTDLFYFIFNISIFLQCLYFYIFRNFIFRRDIIIIQRINFKTARTFLHFFIFLSLFSILSFFLFSTYN